MEHKIGEVNSVQFTKYTYEAVSLSDMDSQSENINRISRNTPPSDNPSSDLYSIKFAKEAEPTYNFNTHNLLQVETDKKNRHRHVRNKDEAMYLGIKKLENLFAFHEKKGRPGYKVNHLNKESAFCKIKLCNNSQLIQESLIHLLRNSQITKGKAAWV